MSVLITHPGRQHSHQAALALDHAGLLAAYWAGVPPTAASRRAIPRALAERFLRYAPIPLPAEKAAWLPLAPSLRQVSHRLPQRLGAELDWVACRAFDVLAAKRLERWLNDASPSERPTAVLACEISALSTFEVAKRHGLATWLDAPSIHRAAQDRLHGTTDSPRLHSKIAAIKDREIELADAIVTVSEFTRGTYLEAGVEPTKVFAIPLGADLSLFRPREVEPTQEPQEVRFLFVGAQIVRKGYDLLLRAFERVAPQVPSVHLRVVGPAGDASASVSNLLAERFSTTGSITQTSLVAEFQAADVLVLPSRNDSYGMVVAEALASGLPVVVSDHVGAADLVTSGENGWVIPADDLESLVARLLAIARDPASVRSLRTAARRSAESATWEAYHERFAQLARERLALHEATLHEAGRKR